LDPEPEINGDVLIHCAKEIDDDDDDKIFTTIGAVYQQTCAKLLKNAQI